MYFLGIVALILCRSSLGSPVPGADPITVQVQQWGMLGTQQVKEQVLLNGVSLVDKSQEFNNIIQTISADALLPALISVNQTSVLRNHTVLRSRECILEGSKLHWSDRVFYDGVVFLTLDQTGTWTAHIPEALAFKLLWEQDERHTRTEGTHLQEGCIKLMRELMLSNEQSVPGTPLPGFLIPILAFLTFTGLILASLFLLKNRGLRHPGGVVGSIIHYPKDMTDTAPDIRRNGYVAL